MQALLLFALATTAFAQDDRAIQQDMGKLRSLDDAAHVKAIRSIAERIRALPASESKLGLAVSLSNLATEGDAGPGGIQFVADTIRMALEAPIPKVTQRSDQLISMAYKQLAALKRYEGVRVDSKSPLFAKADHELAEVDRERQVATFSLKDLDGKTWNLSELKGKVVLVNFWATWCPPCRKEMPDLQKFAQEFKDKDLVILAISDETDAKVRPFIADKGYTFPVLLDPGRTVNLRYHVLGIPNSFIYGRDGKLVAQAMDMRTREQFLKLLAKAGLR